MAERLAENAAGASQEAAGMTLFRMGTWDTLSRTTLGRAVRAVKPPVPTSRYFRA